MYAAFAFITRDLWRVRSGGRYDGTLDCVPKLHLPTNFWTHSFVMGGWGAIMVLYSMVVTYQTMQYRKLDCIIFSSLF